MDTIDTASRVELTADELAWARRQLATVAIPDLRRAKTIGWAVGFAECVATGAVTGEAAVAIARQVLALRAVVDEPAAAR